MALFINDETAVIWRGPMVTKLETEFLFNVEWGELDCLVLDLPPGTGDAQLTITQRVALDGGVIVTTPQEIALLDVKRGVAMFEEVHVPVLGVVENMSYYLCRKCNHRHEIFAHGGGARLARSLNVPFLGELPLVRELREGGDQASPIVAVQPGASGERGVQVDCGESDRRTRPIRSAARILVFADVRTAKDFADHDHARRRGADRPVPARARGSATRKSSSTPSRPTRRSRSRAALAPTSFSMSSRTT